MGKSSFCLHSLLRPRKYIIINTLNDLNCVNNSLFKRFISRVKKLFPQTLFFTPLFSCTFFHSYLVSLFFFFSSGGHLTKHVVSNSHFDLFKLTNRLLCMCLLVMQLLWEGGDFAVALGTGTCLSWAHEEVVGCDLKLHAYNC